MMRVHYEMCVSIEYSKEAIKNSYNHRFENNASGQQSLIIKKA